MRVIDSQIDLMDDLTITQNRGTLFQFWDSTARITNSEFRDNHFDWWFVGGIENNRSKARQSIYR